MVGNWLESWKLLVVFSSLLTGVVIAVVLYAIYLIPPNEHYGAGLVVVALLSMIFLALLFFAISLMFIPPLQMGGPVKSVASVLLILAGSFAYWRLSFSPGLFPVFLIWLGAGGLGLYEEHVG